MLCVWGIAEIASKWICADFDVWQLKKLIICDFPQKAHLPLDIIWYCVIGNTDNAGKSVMLSSCIFCRQIIFQSRNILSECSTNLVASQYYASKSVIILISAFLPSLHCFTLMTYYTYYTLHNGNVNISRIWCFMRDVNNFPAILANSVDSVGTKLDQFEIKLDKAFSNT